MDDNESTTLYQQENMQIKGQSARHLVMQVRWLFTIQLLKLSRCILDSFICFDSFNSLTPIYFIYFFTVIFIPVSCQLPDIIMSFLYFFYPMIFIKFFLNNLFSQIEVDGGPRRST